MGPTATGIVLLIAGAGVYAWNTERHEGQLVFPGLDPDQSAAAILLLGILLVLRGGWKAVTRGGESDGSGS
jgi:hypothetical protein